MSVAGLTAILVHLFNHAVIVMKGALFLGAGCIVLFFYAEPVFRLLEPIVGR